MTKELEVLFYVGKLTFPYQTQLHELNIIKRSGTSGFRTEGQPFSSLSEGLYWGVASAVK